MTNCIICDKKLVGRQSKYCSNKCKCSTTNAKFQCYEAQQARGLERKLRLIKMSGGRCSSCGYNRNSAALVFHHTADKKFKLDMRSLSNRKWESCVAEVKKCTLLCANCHMETHHPDCALTN